jgi:hypothetical protein
MKTIRGVSSGHLPKLEDVLWEWVALQERFARLENWKDVPWWYNERASLSGFAGAVWRAGGLVLEEYITEKRDISSAKDRKFQSVGRSDMYLVVSRSWFIVEAKQCWTRLQDEEPAEEVHLALRAAEAEVGRAKTYGRERRLAAAFVAPRLPVSYRRQIDMGIEAWIHAMSTVPDCARAWVFPEEARHMLWAKKFYPGAAVFIRRAD